MTIQYVGLLSEKQLAYVYSQGTFITRRWNGVHQAVYRYQRPHRFFGEVNDDVHKNEVTHLFALAAGSKDNRLENYASFVKLPEVN